MASGNPAITARVFALALALLTAGTLAAPPPPARPPAALDEPVDGYDMRQPYQLWRYWVEKQKGPITEALLESPDEIDGLKPLGLLFRFTRHNDFGHYLTGEVRSYCRTTAPNGYIPVPGSCRYLLRSAYVPFATEDYDKTNPVSEWTLANFDAVALAYRFRDLGLGPETNWWSVGGDRLFAAGPSPKEVLAENAVVVRLDSIECPQMGEAIETLEGEPIGIPIDFATVGHDQALVAPGMHSTLTNYRIYLRAEGSNLWIEGSGGRVARLISPILEAADGCERKRNADA